MIHEQLPVAVMDILQQKYLTPESRKDLRLNTDLIGEILDIIDYLNYKIVNADPAVSISATAIEQFELPFRQWVQHGSDYYMPTEQILRDLKNQGWLIIAPDSK